MRSACSASAWSCLIDAPFLVRVVAIASRLLDEGPSAGGVQRWHAAAGCARAGGGARGGRRAGSCRPQPRRGRSRAQRRAGVARTGRTGGRGAGLGRNERVAAGGRSHSRLGQSGLRAALRQALATAQGQSEALRRTRNLSEPAAGTGPSSRIRRERRGACAEGRAAGTRPGAGARAAHPACHLAQPAGHRRARTPPGACLRGCAGRGRRGSRPGGGEAARGPGAAVHSAVLGQRHLRSGGGRAGRAVGRAARRRCGDAERADHGRRRRGRPAPPSAAARKSAPARR